MGCFKLERFCIFETHRVVAIQDVKLGCLQYMLMFMVAAYVLGYQMWYLGDQFVTQKIVPSWRTDLTWTGSDFLDPSTGGSMASAPAKQLTELPYCKQYTGHHRRRAPVQKECENFNSMELWKPVEGGFMIPSFIQHYYLKQICNETALDCKQKYAFVDENGTMQDEPKASKEVFVGESEHFKLLLQHTFQTPQDPERWRANSMQGYWKPTEQFCSVKGLADCDAQPIEVRQSAKKGENHHHKVSLRQKRKKALQQSRSFLGHPAAERSLHDDRAEAEEFAPPIYRLNGSGEVIELDNIYAMGGFQPDDLGPEEEEPKPTDDHGKEDHLSLFGKHVLQSTRPDIKWTRRMRSRYVTVQINYNNYLPWNTILAPRDPEYTLSFNVLPSSGGGATRYTQMIDLSGEAEKNMKNTGGAKVKALIVCYGPIVLVKSEGTLGAFSLFHTLLFFGGLIVLLELVQDVTTFVAINVSDHRDGIMRLTVEEFSAEWLEKEQQKADEENAREEEEGLALEEQEGVGVPETTGPEAQQPAGDAQKPGAKKHRRLQG